MEIRYFAFSGSIILTENEVREHYGLEPNEEIEDGMFSNLAMNKLYQGDFDWDYLEEIE